MSVIISDVILPDEFVMAQEDRKIVYFVGAGVSCNAGLPDADKLLKRVEKVIGVKRSGVKKILEKGYEFYYEKLQHLFPNLKKEVEKILMPEEIESEGLKLHEALLNLSYDANGNIRLVTTNFDNLFQRAAKEMELGDLCCYSAPLLPSGNMDWHGLVHLHGRFPSTEEGDDVRSQLTTVLTLSDYGFAYMTNGYAAKFLVDLFRNYTVCFVGYSADENVIRYILSAIASDLSHSAFSNPIFAIDTYKTEQERVEKHNSWTDQSVTPIFVENKSGKFEKHSRFFDEWSSYIKDTVNSKKETAMCEMKKGNNATIDLLSWALCDEDVACEIFSNPSPCPEEMTVIVKMLDNRNVSSREKYFADFQKILTSKLYAFSLFPIPEHVHSETDPALEILNIETCNKIAELLAKWMAHFIKNDEFIKMIVNRYPFISPTLLYELKEAFSLTSWTPEEEEKKRLWSYILEYAQDDYQADVIADCSRAFEEAYDADLLQKEDDLFTRKRLNEILAVKYYPVINKISGRVNLDGSVKFRHSRFPQEHFEKYLPEINGSEETPSRWLSLFEEILLQLSIRIYKLNPRGSIRDIKAIFEAIRQKKLDEDWVFIIVLLRQTWITKSKENLAEAFKVLHKWMRLPYPIFQFLVFQLINQTPPVVPFDKAVQWLLEDNCRILLNSDFAIEISSFIETHREKFLLNSDVVQRFKKDVVEFYEENKDVASVEFKLRLLVNHLKMIFEDSVPPELSFVSLDKFQDVSGVKFFPPKVEVKWLKMVPELGDYSHYSDEELIDYFVTPKEEKRDWDAGTCTKSQTEEWRDFVKETGREGVVLEVLKACNNEKLLKEYTEIFLDHFKKDGFDMCSYIFELGAEDLGDALDCALKRIMLDIQAGKPVDEKSLYCFLEQVYTIEHVKEIDVEKYDVYFLLQTSLSLVVRILLHLMLRGVTEGRAQQILDRILLDECKNPTGRGGIIQNLAAFYSINPEWVTEKIYLILQNESDPVYFLYHWRCFLNGRNVERIPDLLNAFLTAFDSLASKSFKYDGCLYYLFYLGLNERRIKVRTLACAKIKQLLEQGAFSNKFISWLMNDDNKRMSRHKILTFFFDIFPANAYERVKIENVVTFSFFFDENFDAVLRFFIKNELIHFEYATFWNMIAHNKSYSDKLKRLAKESPEVFYEFVSAIYNSKVLKSGYDLILLEKSLIDACNIQPQLKNRQGFEFISRWLSESNKRWHRS